MPFGQHQGTELWNNQFPETRILGLPASRRMRGLVYVASRDKVDVDKFHKDIQYALERLGKSKFGFESTTVSNFKSNLKATKALGTSFLIIPELRALVLTKRHVGSGNEIDCTRAADESSSNLRVLKRKHHHEHSLCTASPPLKKNRGGTSYKIPHFVKICLEK